MDGTWNVEIVINTEALSESYPDQEHFQLPNISSTDSQSLKRISIEGAAREQVDQSSMQLNYRTSSGKLHIRSIVRPYGKQVINGQQESSYQEALSVQEYLNLEGYSELERVALREAADFLFFTDDSVFDRIRKSFYFLTEEFTRFPGRRLQAVDEVLSSREGSSKDLSRFFVGLLREIDIPAREVYSLHLPGRVRGTHSQRINIGAIAEFYYEGRWHTVDLFNNKFLGLGNNIIILHKGHGDLDYLLKTPDLYEVYVAAELIHTRDSSYAFKDNTVMDTFFTKYSLHRLPLSMQSIFYTILLIPLGAVVLSVFRNMIGVNTFGIFTPVLLTLFFLETSLAFGTMFFCVVVFLGLFQRYVLDRMHLLAVPRLSVLLTLVIISYLGLTMFGYFNDFHQFPSGAVNYFPIVIITVFIERFSVYFVEEGFYNTMWTLLGTFIVAVCCFFLFHFKALGLVLFNHPEMLLSTIGLNLLIGQYKGYRLLELFRFRAFGNK